MASGFLKLLIQVCTVCKSRTYKGGYVFTGPWVGGSERSV